MDSCSPLIHLLHSVYQEEFLLNFLHSVYPEEFLLDMLQEVLLVELHQNCQKVGVPLAMRILDLLLVERRHNFQKVEIHQNFE